MLDATDQQVGERRVSNTLQLRALSRDHHGRSYSCRATNSKLNQPLSAEITIEMHRKSISTYGCPYGGIFGPVDRVSVGRIVVSDACNACGHCTATCTSNVRVHQEVRDFGMVVDPGCMKCLDCVSVCPNDALSFKFATPAALKKPRVKAPALRPHYDLTPIEELGVFLAWIGFFFAFRGMFNNVPMLMAVGMAGVGAFCVWKCWCLVRVPNVRAQNLQLRVKGQLTAWGVGMAVLAGVIVLAAAWSGWVRGVRAWADQLDEQVTTTEAEVFRAGYVPDAEQKSLALRAAALLERSGAPGDVATPKGRGWNLTSDGFIRLAWLHAVAGDRARAQIVLERALSAGKPNEARQPAGWL